MTTTYQLYTNELSIELINSIRALYNDRAIEITVSDELLKNEPDAFKRYTGRDDNLDSWITEGELF